MQTARDIYNELRHVQKQLESGRGRRPASGARHAATSRTRSGSRCLPFTTRGGDPEAAALAEG